MTYDLLLYDINKNFVRHVRKTLSNAQKSSMYRLYDSMRSHFKHVCKRIVI